MSTEAKIWEGLICPPDQTEHKPELAPTSLGPEVELVLVPAPVGDVLVEPNLDPDDDVTVLRHRFGALQKSHWRSFYASKKP